MSITELIKLLENNLLFYFDITVLFVCLTKIIV